jgi:hypothetical protein
VRLLKLAEERCRATPIRVVGLAQSAVGRPDLIGGGALRDPEQVVQGVCCHRKTVPQGSSRITNVRSLDASSKSSALRHKFRRLCTWWEPYESCSDERGCRREADTGQHSQDPGYLQLRAIHEVAREVAL